MQNDHHVLAFPLYDGDLFQRLEQSGPFTEHIAQNILVQLSLAIDHLHSHGIIHRDIKLENVLVDGCLLNRNTRVILSDFGFAKKIDDSFTSTPCGTFQYAAPELVFRKNYGKQADIWSLGCLLFTMICAYPPFWTDESMGIEYKIQHGKYEFASPWWDHVSLSVQDLIRHLLQPDSNKRWNARQVLSHPWLSSDIYEYESIEPPQASRSHELSRQFSILNLVNLKTPLPFMEQDESAMGKYSYFDAMQDPKLSLRDYVNAPVEHYQKEQQVKLDLENSNLFKKRKTQQNGILGTNPIGRMDKQGE